MKILLVVVLVLGLADMPRTRISWSVLSSRRDSWRPGGAVFL